MRIVASALVAFVAIEHFAFMILEMFLWSKPIGIRTFRLTPEFAEQSAALAANQGLYNGFLAAGLVWSLVTSRDAFSKKVFFLTCVIVAGVFGAITVGGSILMLQAFPAFIAILLVFFSTRLEPKTE
jgi:putative membrane protein